MSVLLAIGESAISSKLRLYLVQSDFDVIVDEVLHRKYLDESITLNKPSILIIHDLYLPSELDNGEERDLEMLQMIEHWRSVYDADLRIVYLCVRDKQDPFLSQLVARNILDIFYERALNPALFIEQLSSPPRFVNVQKFGTGTLEVDLTDDEEDVTEVKDEQQKDSIFERASKLSSQVVGSAKEIKEKIAKKEPKPPKEPKLPKEPKPEKESSYSLDVMLGDILDIMPIEVMKPDKVKPSIIGTVLIAVAGVKPHMGSTHTALTIANYLAQQGFSVAIFEANYSGDFDRIHSLYEGERQLMKNERYFDINGISHYKYRESIDLNELYASFEYVVLDYGNLGDAAAFEEEFLRAHIRCVLCSADEWKLHWVDEFLTYNKLEKENCTFIIPNATEDKVKDLQDRLNYLDIQAFPTQDNPYEPSREAEDVIRDMLGQFLKASSNLSFSKKALVITSIVSVMITAFIFTVFKVLD